MNNVPTSRCPNTGALIFSTPDYVKTSIQAENKIKALEEKLASLEKTNAKLFEAVENLLKNKE